MRNKISPRSRFGSECIVSVAHLLAHHPCFCVALGLLVALAFAAQPGRAAVTEAWVHRYSNVLSNSGDRAFKVVRDAAGDIIVTGTTDDRIHGQDMLTIKYSSADGTMLWQQRYNGPANSDDSVQAVAVDGSGNVVVTGYSDSGTNTDYYTAKYAVADGTLLWEQRYNGPANSYDGAGAVAVDGSGNVVVTGSSTGTNGIYDFYTAKYAAADGALLWEKRSTNGLAHALAVDRNGDVVVTGYSGNWPNSDYYTAKHAAVDGDLLWERRYNSFGPASYYDSATAVAVDGSGNVVVTGSSNNGTNGDYYTAKYAVANGALLWEKRYNGPANRDDSAQAVAVDANGDVVVTGSSGNVSNYDYYTAKYAAADGALLWEKRYTSPTASYTVAQAVAVDGSGNVAVTGTSSGGYYTAKYAAADGALLWEKRYIGSACGYDEAFAMAVDSSGNVVVTGSSCNGSGNAEFYTAKYVAANGALLWERRYNGPGNGYDSARAVAVDASGNVVVTGPSGSGTDSDYYTAKYAAVDGALLWEKRYNGPANSYDYAYAVAVDGSGNVVVTGYSGNGTNADFCTVKYAAADGALLWEKRYNGPANGDDDIFSSRYLALGPNGMVAITGSSDGNFGSGNTPDYATVVYREANARGAKENVLTELIALRATVTNRNDGRKLDETIKHLTKSLATQLWVDETHLERKHGQRVFLEEKLTVRTLCRLIKSRKSHVSDAVLQGFVDRIFEADRLLAVVAIQDVIAAGASAKKIEQAQKLLAKGDAKAGDDKCYDGIGAFRNAWKLLQANN